MIARNRISESAHCDDLRSRPRLLPWASLCWVACIAAVGVTIAGCSGTSASGVKAGPISVATPAGAKGPASALVVSSTLKMSMTPTGDGINAGVDWTVICGGNPVTGSINNGSCGTFTPAHTGAGESTTFNAPSATPIGNTVTITAAVTANPSQRSSVTLTVLTTPIAVALTNGGSTSLEINTTAGFSAVATNDPTQAGVIWTATCGAAACGSFNPTITGASNSTTYTAPSSVPSSGTVTVTATSLTDTTKSATATITVTGPPPPPPPPQPIAISIVPANIYVLKSGQLRTGKLAAVVSNDATNAGVDWTLSCSASTCGNMAGHTANGAVATFNNTSTVPVGGTITITATSTTDPTKSASATANVVSASPIVVTYNTAPPANLMTGAQATLAATAASGTGGINWTATCGGAGPCGSFSLSPAHTANAGTIVYTAPATVPESGVVTITASSAATSPSNPALANITIAAAPPPTPALSFTQIPPSSLVSAGQVPVAVSVANDVAPGGVTWTVQCNNTSPGGCGWFVPNQSASGATAIYTAPPVKSSGTSVTLTATSVADPTVSISSNPIAINPDTTLSVNFVPSLPAQLQTNTTVNLNAAVTNDASYGGVDWTVCASGCGFFTIKPATPAIPAMGNNQYVPAVPAVTATSLQGWPNGSPIPYTAPAQVPDAGVVSVIASAHTDATKAISGTITISPTPSGPALTGVVQAGTQPVIGATVSLYATGTGGYGSPSMFLVSAPPTDKNGSFTVPAGYTCPAPGSQMYLVATSGAVGQNAVNPNLALMAALESCASLSAAPVVLNEATTIASAFATAPFAADDALTGNKSYLYIGTSSGNAIGLANAFAAVNNLVDISTGKVSFRVPADNADVPFVEINTLADTLNSCTATAGGVEGDGSACGLLFSATDLLGTGTYASSIAPSDTLQAAFNIAQHPVSNYGYNLEKANSLIGLVAVDSPFQPILTQSPNDWSISLNYTSGGGLSSTSAVGSFAVDASGNLWITDTNAGSVIEWNAFGAAISPSTGFPAGGGPIAIDATGNVWISGNGTLNELTNLGSPLPWSPFAGVPGGGGDIAIDSLDNLWITNSGGVNEFNNFGSQLSPSNGFTVAGVTNVSAVEIDSSNNVWFATGPTSDNSTGQIVELANPGGQLITSGGPGSSASQMAADNAGDIWLIGGDQICEAPPYGGKGSVLVPNCGSVGGVNGSGTSGFNVVNPRGAGLDGAGIVWVAGQGGQGLSVNLPPGIVPIKTSSSTDAKPYESASLAAGPLRVAVDGSGNVWVLLANNTVTEYVGAATPVVTPIALGVKNKKLGSRP